MNTTVTDNKMPAPFAGASGSSVGGKRRWPRAEALAVARELCARLKPVCDRLVVAGSLRRGKADVGDVEILYIPRMQERPADLLSKCMVSLAAEEIERMLEDGTLTKRKSRTGSTAWGEKNKLALHRSGVPVDLFSTSAESWWNYLVCRTGPAESNTRICMAAQAIGWKWNPYGSGFSRDGETRAMESEEAVFQFVGLPYWPPNDRR